MNSSAVRKVLRLHEFTVEDLDRNLFRVSYDFATAERKKIPGTWSVSVTVIRFLKIAHRFQTVGLRRNEIESPLWDGRTNRCLSTSFHPASWRGLVHPWFN